MTLENFSGTDALLLEAIHVIRKLAACRAKIEERVTAPGATALTRTRQLHAEGNGANERLGVSDALSDPIVRAVMAADRIDPDCVAALMRHMAARLAKRATSSERA